MAKIFYGVAGEGMGHATRSRPIIDHLKKNHSVMVFSSGRSYNYMKRYYDDVHEIQGDYIIYKKNKVSEWRTFLLNLKNFPNMVKSYKMARKAMIEEKPDLIITDYEPIVCRAAIKSKIPIISIDNQHVLDKTKIDIPKSSWFYFKETCMIDDFIIPKADHYIVMSFFDTPHLIKNLDVVAPVLRKEIVKVNPKEGKYILVYQTSDTNSRLLEILKKQQKKCIVYGFHIDKIEDNLTFKSFNENQFLKDIAGCEAVITNGGFTLITEALYLKKPILSIPVGRQFEQIINAHYLEKLGYGKTIKEADEKGISDFLSDINTYKKNLKGYPRHDNKKLFKKLDVLIENLVKKSILSYR